MIGRERERDSEGNKEKANSQISSSKLIIDHFSSCGSHEESGRKSQESQEKEGKQRMESGSGSSTPMKKSGGQQQVLDGSNIMELVGNDQVFSNFVDHKFHELDRDRDGKLSVKELHPAVADIGAALGLPAQGTNPDSDHIYSEVISFDSLLISHPHPLFVFLLNNYHYNYIILLLTHTIAYYVM